jgi:hypothetical protein
MDARKMLEQLLEERRLLDQAIITVEKLASGTKRRGRPPSIFAEARALRNGKNKDRDEVEADS